jgi:sporulation related protein
LTTARTRPSRLRAFLTLPGLSILLLASAGIAQESRPAFVQRPEAELLLLDLRLGQTVLVEGLPAYPVAGGIVVPLGVVCQALDFAITVDVVSGTADGYFIAENRRFSLDIKSQRVLVEGKPRRFDSLRIEVHQDDIYVDTQLLSDWFPFDPTVDLSTLLLTLRPREPLPVQKRQEREQRAKKELSSLGYGGPRYPRVENPYRLFDFPFVDQTLKGIFMTGSSATQSFQYSTFATGDLLYHEASGYILGDQHGVSDYRGTLGRHDPEGGLLGPLRAREYAVGDVLYPGLSSISEPRSGPGFLLSSFPLQRETQFDRNTFRGELPQGWEVELYQNGALIGFQQFRSDGLYQFDNVALLFGLNVFRLVFYGPQGQRREEFRRFNVAESLTPAGEFYYRVVGNDPKDATRRGQLDLDLGLSRHFSLSADLASVEITSVRHDYSRVALRGYSSFLFANAEVVVDFRGGWAAGTTVQTRLGPIGLTLGYTSLQNGYVSETFRPQYGLISSRSSLHLDATIPAGPLPSIPLSVDFFEDKLVSGAAVDHLTGRMSSFYRGLSVSNFIDWRFPRGEPRPLEQVALGDLLVSKFVRNYGFRGELLYDLAPRAEITSASLTAERVFPSYVVQAGVSRFFRVNTTHILASVIRSEGPFGFGVNLDYARPGNLTASVSLNVSLARDPRSGKWISQARSLAGLGAVSPSVFVDANGNGVRDPGEKPMEGVGFLANRASSETRTSADGTALVTGLPPYQDVNVGVAEATLEDPLAVPERPGVRFVPRPGRVTEVDFPVLISGEVTGTVRLVRGGEKHEASGVVVQLVDAHGAVARETRTAYDGFYDFTLIVPGPYDVRISPEQAERLKLKAPAPRRVTILPGGTILDGIDLLLEALEPVPAAQPAPPAGGTAPANEPAFDGATATGPAAGKQADARIVYTIHCTSYRARAGAEEDRVRFEKLGLPVRVVAVELPGRGTVYRVLLGEFTDLAEAKRARSGAAAAFPGEVGHVYPVAVIDPGWRSR